MIPSLHNGVSALKSFTQGLQTLGNNISNVNSRLQGARMNYTDNYAHMQDVESRPDDQPRNQVQEFGGGTTGSLSTNFNQGTRCHA